jgi:PHD/YefM family antitoxin component YafN of YafNO toxin-antitoxin module
MAKPRVLLNRNGKQVGVVLSIKDYEKLMEEIEELNSIRAFDAARSSGETAIPFEQAVAEIESRGKSSSRS